MPYQEMKTLTIDGTTYEIVDNAARSNITTLQALAGAPLVANTVSAMVDTTKVYVYTGSESGYTSGNWYYYSGSAWTSGGVYNSQGIGDGTITNEKLADSTVKLEKLHSEVIAAIGSGGSGTGLTEDIKQALLQCFGYVAWINDQGQTYYEALQSALYPPADLVSISAVYIQTGTVYDTDSLDVLKADLVVTALWDDSSTTTVATYTLSGTLTTGTSIITVTYGGKTTTFNVTVTQAPLDTTVVLDTEHDGKGQASTFGTYANHTSFCPTIKYAHESTISSGNEYIYGIIPVDATGSSTCRVWFWDDNDAGITGSAYGSGKPMNVYAESMTEGSFSLTAANVALYPYLTIPVDKNYKDYAYLYVGSTGKVLFAGANTPYYGMSNISEASS